MTPEKIAEMLGAKTWEDEARAKGWNPPLKWVEGAPKAPGSYWLLYPISPRPIQREISTSALNIDAFDDVLFHCPVPNPPLLVPVKPSMTKQEAQAIWDSAGNAPRQNAMHAWEHWLGPKASSVGCHTGLASSGLKPCPRTARPFDSRCPPRSSISTPAPSSPNTTSSSPRGTSNEGSHHHG